MNTTQFANHLLAHPDAAAAVMALIDAEASLEEDSKHFPYSTSGGSAKDEATAREITSIAQVMVSDHLESEPV